MTRAAVYLRQSFDRNLDELAVSRQREDCLELCSQRGWEPVEYVDNDTSASTGKRPAYERMLKDIKSGEIAAVVAWDLDRLHRRPIELEAFIDLADQNSIALATVAGDVNLGTAQGRLVARLKGSVARHEMEHKSDRQKRAARQLAEAGKPYTSCARAFGYTHGYAEIIPEEADAIRSACEAILSGASLHSVVGAWNAAGIKTSRGGTWVPITVKRVLRHPRNAAIRIHRGEVVDVEATWPAIISYDTWQAVDMILGDKNRRPWPSKKCLLSGVALCGKCGERVSASTNDRDGGTYICRSCYGVVRPRDLLDKPVEELVIAYLGRQDASKLLIDPRRTDLAELRAKEIALDARLTQISVDYADGLLSGRDVKVAREKIESQLKEVHAKMRDANRVRVFEGIIGSPNVRKAWEGLTPERKQAVLDSLLEITILPVGAGRRGVPLKEHISIRWLAEEE